MKIIKLLFITLLFTACNNGPQPIDYGTDACHYCNMTIVDRQHAAEIVTEKGRAYKYDAIECMVNSLQDEFKDTEIAHQLVADFDEDDQLIDATIATYLVSDQISSPMGANLSAFNTEKSAQKAKEDHTGELFTWEEIQKHLKQ